MVSRHNIRRHLRGQLPRLLACFLILSLVLVACERPLQDNNAPAAEEVTEEDLEQGGGVPAETEGEETTGAAEGEEAEEAAEPEPTVEPTEDTAATEEAETAEQETTAEEAAAEEAAAEEAETEEEEGSPRPEDEAEEEAAEGGAEETITEGAEEEAAEAEAAEADDTKPRTHVVQAGENLYRIGLQYGISWVVLAQANNITNANRIIVGQVLTIPSEADDGTPTPTPPPGEETTYVVQPGDNLYRIGRTFNMSWVEIAEANGIVNPNRILVGQELTIPGAAPAEGITHTVQPGETLFRISLQYGVAWTTIATENSITPPYVIYPGQVLTIPGG